MGGRQILDPQLGWVPHQGACEVDLAGVPLPVPLTSLGALGDRVDQVASLRPAMRDHTMTWTLPRTSAPCSIMGICNCVWDAGAPAVNLT